MSERIGVIGLGRIGLAAAKAYLKAGYEVFGCDTNPRALEEFSREGGIALQKADEMMVHTKVILILVLNDEQAIEVITGKSGIAKNLNEHCTVVCMSTINRRTLTSLADACLKRNAAFLDCPFTGGPARLANGNLTLIAAGDTGVLTNVRHALEIIGKIVHVGNEPGLGQAVKHCNQLLVGVTHAATMEVIVLARKLGLDPSLVVSVVSSGIAGSDYFRLLSESVLKKTPSPGGLGQMCKDMGIVNQTLNELAIQPYVALAAAKYFHTATEWGMSGHEGADLIEVVEKAANT